MGTLREVPLSSLLSASWAAEVVLDGGSTVRLSASVPAGLISTLIQTLRCPC